MSLCRKCEPGFMKKYFATTINDHKLTSSRFVLSRIRQDHTRINAMICVEELKNTLKLIK